MIVILITKLNERTFRIVYGDNKSSFEELLRKVKDKNKNGDRDKWR